MFNVNWSLLPHSSWAIQLGMTVIDGFWGMSVPISGVCVWIMFHGFRICSCLTVQCSDTPVLTTYLGSDYINIPHVHETCVKTSGITQCSRKAEMCGPDGLTPFSNHHCSIELRFYVLYAFTEEPSEDAPVFPKFKDLSFYLWNFIPVRVWFFPYFYISIFLIYL